MKNVDCYIVGAKGVSFYGGYESFVQKLLQYHRNNNNIKYHVACKANGDGAMELEKLEGITQVSKDGFIYCGSECCLIHINEKLGSAQAIQYDTKALRRFCKHIKQNHIETPIIYILACRIGPFMKHYARKIHKLGGKVYLNPDGHEWKRAKWSAIIRQYWKQSEKMMVKNADLVICDSVNIEKYIHETYDTNKKKINTTYIAYGAEVKTSTLSDDDSKYTGWLKKHNLIPGNYYMICCRAVPENNFETVIREFINSNTQRDLAVITTHNQKMLDELEEKLHYSKDKRIKFVGTVYDAELLTKIRENAYGYFHGHSVGGTNPTLLEALGTTKLNLLYDVGFNREVGQDAALYWTLEKGNLARLIDRVDSMGKSELDELGKKAKQRIRDAYSWKYITDRYEEVLNKR